MISRGCGSRWYSSGPCGRHSASGLSNAFARFLRRSATHGWNGSPSLNPDPILPKVASGGCPAGWLPGASVRFVRIQMPDKFGLPSDVRDTGAVRFGLPSGPFGTPGCGRNGHCADNDGERAATMAADTTTVNDRFMSASRLRPTACGARGKSLPTGARLQGVQPSPGNESEGWNVTVSVPDSSLQTASHRYSPRPPSGRSRCWSRSWLAFLLW